MILNKIYPRFNIVTAAQFGTDVDITEILATRTNYVKLFDFNCEWAWKNEVTYDNVDMLMYSRSEELIDHLEYHDLNFDLAIVTDRGFSFDHQKAILSRLSSVRTPFILVSSITKPEVNSKGYLRYNTSLRGNNYTLYYLDLIEE